MILPPSGVKHTGVPVDIVSSPLIAFPPQGPVSGNLYPDQEAMAP